MKIFISHKLEDTHIALKLNLEFEKRGIKTYLDTLDSQTSNNGKVLTEHIKNIIRNCTDIIVVMSEKTKNSQWVPFEIGMSAQRDMPTVTFMVDNVELPEFLEYWPRLKYFSDIDKYIKAKKETEQRIQIRGIYESANAISDTEMFYQILKQKL